MTTNIGPSATSPTLIPPSSWAPLALLGGLVWASVGVIGGAGWATLLALWGGGALSLWAGLITVAECRRSRRFFGWLLAAAGISLLVNSWFGTLLVSNTHHRPLGAVTFVIFASALGCFAALAFARLRTTRLPALVLLLVGVAAVSLRTELGAWVPLAEALMGAALIGALTYYSPRLSRLRRWSRPAVWLVLCSAVAAVWLAPPDSDHAVILGLPGLVR